MSKYIKSHSNYVLKKKHQMTKEGVIFERDATTIGGLDQFAKGQTPIYKSSNFIITINQENESSRLIGKPKWEENENGEYWSMDNITLSSGETTQIEIKRDYTKLKDFAYYGSCSELIRASITNILKWYPAELYVARNMEDSSKGNYAYVKDIDNWTKLSDEDVPPTKLLTFMWQGRINFQYVVDNPFGVNIYTSYLNEEDIDVPIRYFANEGYKNFDLWVDDNVNKGAITTYSVTSNTTACKIGDWAYIVTLKTNDNTTMQIACCLDDYCEPTIYLVPTTYLGYHLRPNQQKIDDFFKNLDYFEKALLNRDSKPLYTARFEIIKETPYGYRAELEDFTFPTTYGGYNLGANTNAYQTYINRLIRIGAYYDEYFCDNMYRCMTHEAIKNFDWTFTREYIEGDEEQYVEGGTKIQNLIRLFAREFDEIRQYIEGIKDYNSLSYYNNKGIPNYMMSDALETEGWDFRNIYPFIMDEVITKEDGTQESIKTLLNNIKVQSQRLGNTFDGQEYVRTFKEDLETTVKPFASNLSYWCHDGYSDVDTYYGYYISSTTKPTPTSADGFVYHRNKTKKNNVRGVPITETTKSQRFFDGGDCGNNVNKIKEYTSDKEYSMVDVNNHFMKMLLLNSRGIMRKKGTAEGIESMLSLFGFRSKRWFDSLSSQQKGRFEDLYYDFEVSEHVAFTTGLIDKYVDSKDMYQIDWYNFTKTIYYDNDDYRSGVYNAYQGLPVNYYYANKEKEDGSKEIVRLLYPYFDKDGVIDGNPYFQMNGGWLDRRPYIFDENNLVLPKELTYSADTKYLHSQTIRNIKSVENLSSLLNLSPSIVSKDVVYHVKDLSGEYVVIGGEIFDVYEETTELKTYKYFVLTKRNGMVKVGDLELNNVVYLSSPYSDYEYEYKVWEEYDSTKYKEYEDYERDGFEIKSATTEVFVLDEYEDGDELKCYLMSDEDDESKYNILMADSNGLIIQEFSRFYDGHQEGMPQEEASEFFVLNDADYSHELSTLGWSQLSVKDDKYRIVKLIVDYFKGNNPHGTEKPYDNGYEYISYFTHLFKYADENNEWDERCYQDDEDYANMSTQEDRTNVGFKALTERVPDDFIVYDKSIGTLENPLYKSISGDTKIHYFGDLYRKTVGANGANEIKKLLYSNYDDEYYDFEHDDEWYDIKSQERGVERYDYSKHYDGKYNFTDSDIFGDECYSEEVLGELVEEFIASGKGENYSVEEINGVTDQIMNIKVVDLNFYMHSPTPFLDSHMMTELKYLDDIVLSYATQMIPAGTILKVRYYKCWDSFTVYSNVNCGTIRFADSDLDVNKDVKVIDGVAVYKRRHITEKDDIKEIYDIYG